MEGSQQSAATSTFMGIEVTPGVAKGNFYFLFIISFLAQWVMITLLLIRPAFFKEVIGIPDASAGLINATMITVAFAAGLLFTILVGALSDRFGRKPLLFIGFSCTGLMYIVYGHTKTIANVLGLEALVSVLILLGVISFIFAAVLLFTWPQVITLAADYTTPKSRGRIMAIQGMMMGLSAIIMYGAFAQLPKYIGIIPMFYLGAFFCLLCYVLSRIGLVEKLPERKAERKTLDDIKELFREVNKSIELKVGYLNILSGRADIGILASFVIIWMVTVCQDYGYTPAKATAMGGIALAIMSICMQIQMPFAGILVDKWGRIPTMILTLVVGGIGLCLLGLVENPFSTTLRLVIIFCGTAMVGGLSAQALVADSAPRHLVGTALGGLNMAMIVGGIIFTQAGGFLFDRVGYGMPFILKGMGNLAVAAYVFSVRKRIKDLGRRA
jgi:MFS family permease